MRSFSASYDELVDVLHVSRRPFALGDGEGVDDSLVLEFAVEDGTPSGATVLGFRRNDWSSRTRELGASLERHLALPPDLVGELVEAAMASPGDDIVLTIDDDGHVVSVSAVGYEDAHSKRALASRR